MHHLPVKCNMLPKSHWWDYYSNTLSSHYNSFEGWSPVDEIYRCLIFKWVAVTWLNTFRPKQNDRHFPNNILKWIFLNESLWISIKISLTFVPISPIYIPALVQIMVWCRPGNKPLSEPMMVSLLTHHWPQCWEGTGGRYLCSWKTRICLSCCSQYHCCWWLHTRRCKEPVYQQLWY